VNLRSLPGGVPEPEELIGRDHLIDVLWNQLAGNNILLVAPRRFGKTGVMRHVLKRPRPKYLPLYLEVEEIASPEAFASELIRALLEQSRLRSILSAAKRLPGKITDLIKEHVDEVSVDEFTLKLKDALGDSWDNITRRLVLEMEKADETVVFILDEFPQLLDNIVRQRGEEAARSFLSWFRALRMHQKDELRRFRFVIGGSTGIDIILRRLDASDKLNDFFRLPVGPVSREDGEFIIQRLADRFGLRFTTEASDALLTLIGPPVPYFIHLFVSQIIIDPELKARSLTPDDMQKVYRNRLIGPACRGYFELYRQRLRRYGASGEQAAIAILREIANVSSGRVSDSALYDVYRKARKKGATDVEFREIMADLECDWYVSLDPSTNEYYFLLDVMRDWWKRFYRKFNTGRK
jgi:hypothetical protein